MHRLSVVALLLGPCLLSQCSQAPTSSSSAAVDKPAADTSHVPTGIASQLGPLGPSASQHQVRANVLFQEPTLYAVTLPVQHDRDGTILLSVKINPKTHSAQKLEALFAPLNKAVKYRQIGEGISRYDAPTGRYYFSTAYQKIKLLATDSTNHGAPRQITGWVAPGTSQAAVAEEAIPDPAG